MPFYQLLSTETTLSPVVGAAVITIWGTIMAYMFWSIRSDAESFLQTVLESRGTLRRRSLTDRERRQSAWIVRTVGTFGAVFGAVFVVAGIAWLVTLIK